MYILSHWSNAPEERHIGRKTVNIINATHPAPSIETPLLYASQIGEAEKRGGEIERGRFRDGVRGRKE